MSFYLRLSLSAGTILTLLSGAAYAQSTDIGVVKYTSNAASPDKATAVVNGLAPPDTSGVAADVGADKRAAGVMTNQGPADLSAPQAFGTFGIPYTITRVQAGNQSAAGTTVANNLSTTYPYRTIGKFTFTRPNGASSFCSASLIRRSVLVTAAHCYQAFGSNATVYSNFLFRPGHYGAAGATAAQIAPYGSWTVRFVARAATWANGTDVGSGSARDNDIAVFIVSKNASNQFLGDIVGYMSYGWNNYSFVTSPKVGNLRTAAVSTLGYPALLDSGQIMQRTDGPTYTTTVSGSKQLWQGSSLTGGSSGGPWVVNFSGRNPTLSGGAAQGAASAIAVIGVTSWGSADPNTPKDNYASQFGQNSRYPNADYSGRGAGNIGSLLATACAGAAPGGGTYASQGYCN